MTCEHRARPSASMGGHSRKHCNTGSCLFSSAAFPPREHLLCFMFAL